MFWANLVCLAVHGTRFAPMIVDDWYMHTMYFLTAVYYTMYNYGCFFSGMHRAGYFYWLFAMFLFLIGIGNVLTGLIENLSMFNFMFFVDKFKLEFKVIRKDIVDIKDENKLKDKNRN